MLQRRVGREHVVVGGDDADVGRALDHDAQLVVAGHGSKGMRHIGATQPLGAAIPFGMEIDLLQICTAGVGAALADALRDGFNGGMY